MKHKLDTAGAWGLIVIVASLLLYFAPFSAFADTCYAHPTAQNSNATIGYPDGSNTQGDRYAQPFTLSADCTLTNVAGIFGIRGSSPAAITPYLYADSAGSVGSLLATGAAFSPAGGTTWATTTISYAATAGVQYWLEFGTATANASNEYQWYGSGTNGTPALYNKSGSWVHMADGNAGDLSLNLYGTTGGGGGGTISSATSSVDQTQRNMWSAYWVFFTMFLTVLWLGRSTKT